MELVVLPKIENEAERTRTQDELPQSAAGRTIMTTEPKFVPNNAVTIHVEEGMTLKRFTARAKGRGNRIHKPTCHIFVSVGE